MSERLGAADKVVGVAAVAEHGRGRIAYVLFDRVIAAATDAVVDPMHVLGLVMAHEIAHLLLPPKPHSLTGLMRPGWDVREFREDASSSRFGFTETQADQIRHHLRQGDAPSPGPGPELLQSGQPLVKIEPGFTNHHDGREQD